MFCNHTPWANSQALPEWLHQTVGPREDGGTAPSLLPPGAASPSHPAPSSPWTLSQPPPHSPWGTATPLCTRHQTPPPPVLLPNGQNFGEAPGTCSGTSAHRSHSQWHRGSSRFCHPTNTHTICTSIHIYTYVVTSDKYMHKHMQFVDQNRHSLKWCLHPMLHKDHRHCFQCHLD